MAELRAGIVMAAMRLISEGRSVTDYESFGIAEPDWELIRSERIWLSNDVSTVRRIFQTLAFGVLDVCGVSHFRMSAEYLARIVTGKPKLS